MYAVLPLWGAWNFKAISKCRRRKASNIELQKLTLRTKEKKKEYDIQENPFSLGSKWKKSDPSVFPTSFPSFLNKVPSMALDKLSSFPVPVTSLLESVLENGFLFASVIDLTAVTVQLKAVLLCTFFFLSN